MQDTIIQAESKIHWKNKVGSKKKTKSLNLKRLNILSNCI